MIEFKLVSKAFFAPRPIWSLKKSVAVQANRDISLSCQPGQIHGLLGVNGAGKSTALKMLSGLLKPDSGHVLVDGIDVANQTRLAQSKLGIFLNTEGLSPKLTARENIKLFASLHQMADADEATSQILDELHMNAIADRRTQGFSTGQRMKVALARALVHQPKYLILDEPTRGLDVMSVRLLREHLSMLKLKGCGVLFSSHVMEEVDKLCDAITVIHDGQVCFDGALTQFKSTAEHDNLEHAFIQVVGA